MQSVEEVIDHWMCLERWFFRRLSEIWESRKLIKQKWIYFDHPSEFCIVTIVTKWNKIQNETKHKVMVNTMTIIGCNIQTGWENMLYTEEWSSAINCTPQGLIQGHVKMWVISTIMFHTKLGAIIWYSFRWSAWAGCADYPHFACRFCSKVKVTLFQIICC